MMKDVKIKVRPQQTVHFPALCVYCMVQWEPQASTQVQIQHRMGRTTRQIDVPLCVACAATVAQRSDVEARLQTLSWVITAAITFLVLASTLLLTPVAMPFALRLLVATLVATLFGGLTWSLFQRAKQRAAPPEKKAIQTAAAIDNFSWRTTTFKFANETFAERFRLLNESLLME